MGEKEINVTQYRQMVGKLIYVTKSTPCIVYAINVVSRFMARP